MEETNKKRILVVDDDDNLRSVLIDKLNISGFDVAGASDGREGLNKAFELRPDIILLDVLMPIMNGQEMLRKLREDEEWGKKVKVIMLTVVEDATVIAQAVQDGSFAYLIKTDQSIDDIVEKIKGMLKM
ncbi:MAG: response regulator [Patescibacteria group bacterium]